MKIRTRLQPTREAEVDEGERRVLEHQGLLWNGTDAELAAHYRAAGLDLPPTAGAPAAPETAAPSGAASTTTAKEG